jgi:hypothetical protein
MKSSDWKWRIESYSHNKEIGVTTYVLKNDKTEVKCQSTKKEDDVRKDIDIALARLNKKYTLKSGLVLK